MSRFKFLKFSLVSTLILLLAACANNYDPTANLTPDEILKEARRMARDLQYDEAIEYYEKLEGRAAGTILAQQAQIEKAHTHLKNEQSAQAVATLDRFMRLHPASPAIDYALYLKGLANFNDNLGLFSWLIPQDLSERDQNAAKESWASFRELVTRFPESRYAPDARARMNYIVNTLAMNEVHVARYYHRRGAHVAAIARAQQAIADYREAPALEDALALLISCYDALGLTDLRDDVRRVLQASYPESPYLTGQASVLE